MSIINNHTLQPLIPPHPPPQAHYYAKTYNWRFADWQSADFASLHQDPAQLNALKLAMEQEAGVTDADCARFMAGYYKRMNPTQPANACGCCGTMDVPIPDDEKLAENLGILSFTEIPLPRLALRQHHHCGAERGGYPCSAQCPWLLAPLTYSDAENAAYDAPWPAHITPPLQLRGPELEAWREEQRKDWLRFRRIISMVEVDADGRAVSRIGYGSPTEPQDMHGDRIPAPSTTTERSLRLHLYPELCTASGTGADRHCTALCGQCLEALLKGRVPEPSIAAAWDLGTPAYADMPELSWAEKRAVSKTRILSSALNIEVTRKAGTYHCSGGNCIAFADLAADTCAAALPSAEFAAADIFVSIQAPRGALRSRRLEGALESFRRGPLRCNVEHVMTWLRAGRFLSVDVYGSVSLTSTQAASVAMESFIDGLMRRKELLSTSQPCGHRHHAKKHIIQRRLRATVNSDTRANPKYGSRKYRHIT